MVRRGRVRARDIDRQSRIVPFSKGFAATGANGVPPPDPLPKGLEADDAVPLPLASPKGLAEQRVARRLTRLWRDAGAKAGRAPDEQMAVMLRATPPALWVPGTSRGCPKSLIYFFFPPCLGEIFHDSIRIVTPEVCSPVEKNASAPP